MSKEEEQQQKLNAATNSIAVDREPNQVYNYELIRQRLAKLFPSITHEKDKEKDFHTFYLKTNANDETGNKIQYDRDNNLIYLNNTDLETMKAAIKIAKNDGAKSVDIEGLEDEQAKQNAWIAAKLLNLDVKGYDPSQTAKDELAKLQQPSNEPIKANTANTEEQPRKSSPTSPFKNPGDTPTHKPHN